MKIFFTSALGVSSKFLNCSVKYQSYLKMKKKPLPPPPPFMSGIS